MCVCVWCVCACVVCVCVCVCKDAVSSPNIVCTCACMHLCICSNVRATMHDRYVMWSVWVSKPECGMGVIGLVVCACVNGVGIVRQASDTRLKGPMCVKITWD